MPEFPDEFRAEPGRAIPPAWEGLQAWVDDYPTPPTAPGVRVREWPDGVDYFAPRPLWPWVHPWRASVSGTVATIGPGTINLETPRMGPELLTLDGLDLAGNDTGRFPELPLLEDEETGGPGEDGFSYICARLLCDPESGQPAIEEEPEEWLTVVHLPTLPAGYQSGGMPESIEDDYSVGYDPLVKLYWSEDGERVDRYFQIAIHNATHEFRRGRLLNEETGERAVSRHYFFGAR